MKVYLYSTQGCHLCEQAKTVLWPLLMQYSARLKEIDIAVSDEIIENYGTRIPVLGASELERELNWPFTAEEIDVFLTELADI